MRLPQSLKKNFVIAMGVTLWLPAVGLGINALWKYSTTPGRPATPPLEWPRHTSLNRAPGKYTLLMFAHPQCPCSDASLGELAILMAHAPENVDAQVFFYRALHENDSWAKTGLWEQAARIPGVKTLVDPDAAMARSFGAFTSGQTLLYDAAGHLIFKGGITAYRGHSGDNLGLTLITSVVNGKTPAGALPFETHVFGCTLQGE